MSEVYLAAKGVEAFHQLAYCGDLASYDLEFNMAELGFADALAHIYPVICYLRGVCSDFRQNQLKRHRLKYATVVRALIIAVVLFVVIVRSSPLKGELQLSWGGAARGTLHVCANKKDGLATTLHAKQHGCCPAFDPVSQRIIHYCFLFFVLNGL